jgi:hypothetical protein
MRGQEPGQPEIEAVVEQIAADRDRAQRDRATVQVDRATFPVLLDRRPGHLIVPPELELERAGSTTTGSMLGGLLISTFLSRNPIQPTVGCRAIVNSWYCLLNRAKRSPLWR